MIINYELRGCSVDSYTERNEVKRTTANTGAQALRMCVRWMIINYELRGCSVAPYIERNEVKRTPQTRERRLCAFLGGIVDKIGELLYNGMKRLKILLLCAVILRALSA